MINRAAVHKFERQAFRDKVAMRETRMKDGAAVACRANILVNR